MTLGTRPPTDLLVEPSARTVPLADLVKLVREGKVRVPHFQRGFRWQPRDAVKLIDSVLRGFPIGSLLLWQKNAPAGTVQLHDVRIEAPEMPTALYVVDGQQRIVSFLNVFDDTAGREGDFALVYDLGKEPFKVRLRRKSDENTNDAIPLPDLFELTKVLRWVGEHPRHVDSVDRINEATQRLRQYNVPVYEVSSQDDQVLREIYDRMNNAGKRLSRAEAFWGLHAPDEKAKQAQTLQTIRERLRDELAWGEIDPATLLHSFLARRGPDVFRDIHIEFDGERESLGDFAQETKEAAHEGAFDALRRAITFLRDHVNVPHFSFLPNSFILIVLTRFFAFFPKPHPRNLDLLQRWYWRTLLVGPALARGSTTSTNRELCGCVQEHQEDDSVQRLLDKVSGLPLHYPNPRKFNATSAETRIMLCALWSMQPQNPDGTPVSASLLTETIGDAATPSQACPRLFPGSQLTDELYGSLANRLIAPDVPDEVLRDFGSWADTALEANLIDPQLPPDKLVHRRLELLDESLRRLLDDKMARGSDDSRPLEAYNLDLADEEPSEGDGFSIPEESHGLVDG